ncbi:hypothetical protein LOTGIDRAFT_159891 [Lottia gigantea]|uniref:FH2 domain-containing protein n=1 Tax=Lottia gigantea TaxID=225164 RepID=V4AHU6_LOTGI|nr:hypothetical protein LOTGIDRAFT_159891 [Lottia gigantea]ESO96477.1 hypothetical protein LOTGIDRAFT_159891 [Lottia gigantea]
MGNFGSRKKVGKYGLEDQGNYRRINQLRHNSYDYLSEDENYVELEKVKNEYTVKIEECKARIYDLQREVAHYQVLAGIEKLTQEALNQAQIAGEEEQPFSTYQLNGYENGSKSDLYEPGERIIALTGTPQRNNTLDYNNQITPECVRNASSFPQRTTPEDHQFPPLHPPPELVPTPKKPIVSPLGNVVPPKDSTSASNVSDGVHPPPAPSLSEGQKKYPQSGPFEPNVSQTPQSAPPPPPPPAIGGGPPPPPPLPPGMGPPPPPPLPGMGPPPPPPLPGAPGSLIKAKGPSKPVISPKSPMKPLFWQRLQVHVLKQREKKLNEHRLFWEKVEEPHIDLDEFDSMFCKLPVEKKTKTNNTKKKDKTKQVAKIIDAKRSQTIGIFLSSLKLEMADIENAILNLDTSVIDQDKLKTIYDMKPTDDESKMIIKFISKNPDTPLDKPDQFLHDLVQIPDYSERIFCFIFQSTFQEEISVIDSKLHNLKMTCEDLTEGSGVQRIFGLILTFGNYMNGGSRTRGQADGFGLEILPKIRDVKGKDNRTSLLQYVVYKYIERYEREDAGTDHVKLPLPDPSDISQASLVNFDDIKKDLKRIKKDFESAEKRAEKVLQSKESVNCKEPFSTVMSTFFVKGKQEFSELEELLQECFKKFEETVIFFCVKAKSGEKEVTPGYFFSFWSSFCQEFKICWKKEQQKIVKERIKEAENHVKRLTEEKKMILVQTRSKKAGGLKDRLAKQGMF